MTANAVGSAPNRTLATVARVVTWPLTSLVLAIGLAWRVLVAAPTALVGRAARRSGEPDEDGRAGGLGAYLRAAGRYLGFRSARFPAAFGRVAPESESPGPWHEVRRRLSRNRLGLWAWIVVVVYLYVAIGAQFRVVAGDFDRLDKASTYASPQGFDGPHFFGTDQVGADTGSIALRGTLTALWIGTLSALLACAIGTAFGAVAGYFGGWIDAAIVWIFTTLESIPELLLLLSFAYVFRKNPAFADAYESSFLHEFLGISVGLFTIVLAIGFTGWVGVCRTVRGEFIRHRDRDYVTAAKALGVPTRRILFGHVLPNVFHLVLVSFSLLFIAAIKSEVILSFLGIGLDAGEASWGQMINHAKLELTRDPMVWWPLTAATGLMFGLVLSVNLFTDALRDALDPKLKH
jgi:ABC-type dipeptide/oligopeptide/nickel transport system permease subunit